MSRNRYSFSGTKRDQIWEDINSLKYDYEKLIDIENLLIDGFKDDGLNEYSQKIIDRILNSKIKQIRRKINDKYKELKLIK